MLDPIPYQGPASCCRCGKELPFGYSAATVVTFCDDCIPKLSRQQVPVRPDEGTTVETSCDDGVKSQAQSAINPFKATIPISKPDVRVRPTCAGCHVEITDGSSEFFCSACLKDVTRMKVEVPFEVLRSEPPSRLLPNSISGLGPSTLAKFILETHTFDGGSVTVFARGDNEMIVGKVTTSKDSAAQAMFGEIPGQDQITRAFLTEQAAIAWVKEQCMQYGGRRDVDWIVRKVEHGEQDLIVPAKGPMMPPRKM